FEIERDLFPVVCAGRRRFGRPQRIAVTSVEYDHNGRARAVQFFSADKVLEVILRVWLHYERLRSIDAIQFVRRVEDDLKTVPAVMATVINRHLSLSGCADRPAKQLAGGKRKRTFESTIQKFFRFGNTRVIWLNVPGYI